MPLPSTITSNDNNIFSGVTAQLYAGPNAALGQSISTAAQTITVGAGGAASGATSIPVTALPVALPSGTVLTFLSGKTATLTAAAASGATTLSVAALAAAIAAGDTAQYSPMVLVPGLETLNFTIKGQVEKVNQFGTLWSRAAKNGLEGTFKLSGVAPSANPVIADLIAAGLAASPAARRSFILALPDGGYFYGFGTVSEASPMLDPRKSFRYDFGVETDGAWQFQAGTLT
jgi:hypothetical protein